MKPPDKLAAHQIERRLGKLRMLAAEARIRTGWIRYMRQAMSMSLKALSQQTQLALATVQQIEKREVQGKVTIETMRKIAASMECEFVYALVPKDELRVVLMRKAVTKASRIVQEADLHMVLEDQEVPEELHERVQRVADDLIESGDIW